MTRNAIDGEENERRDTACDPERILPANDAMELELFLSSCLRSCARKSRGLDHCTDLRREIVRYDFHEILDCNFHDW
jgi:hypothetical protein